MRIFLIIVYYFLSAQLWAQSPHAFDLGELYDFNVKTIYDLHQDKNSVLWVGTDQGLFKFDGTDFQRYKVEKYQSEFSSFKEDKTGRIWFQNFTGQIFYFENKEIKLFTNFNNYSTDGLITFDVSLFPDIYITSDKDIRIIPFSPTKVETKLPKSTTAIDLPDSLKQNFIYNLLIHDSSLYFSVSTKLFKQGRNGLKFISQFEGSLKKRIFQYKNGNELYALGLNTENELTIKFLNRDKTADKKITGLPELIPQSIYFDESTGYFWIGSYAGLFCFTKDFDLVSEKPFLQEYAISSLLKDTEGNYLISTLQNGILVIPSLAILIFDELNSALENNFLLDLVKVNDTELLILDNKSTLYLFSVEERKIIRKIKLNERITNLHHNQNEQIVYLFPSKQWLNLANFETEQSLVFNIKNISKINDSLYLISKIEGAEITAHTKKDDSFDFFASQNYPIISATEENLSSMLLRQKRSIANIAKNLNDFYVAYSDGLFHYKNGVSKRLTYQNDNLIISHFAKGDKEDIWALSTDGRLFKLIEDRIQFQNEFDIGVLNLKKQGDDILIASDKGIIRYNSQNKTSDYINILDGMPTDKVNNLVISNNYIFAATTHGLVQIPSTYNYKNPLSPEVKIRNIWVNDQLSDYEKIKNLEFSENNIRIELNTYAVRSRKMHKFAYRFINIDTSWIYTKSNIITYNSLSPGNYDLEILGINEDNVASNRASLLNIKILKPYYQQWWFYLLSAVLSIAIISYVYFVRFRNFQIRSQLKESLAESKQKLAESSLASIRAQMNPHFLFNAINSVQMLISEGENEQSQKYLNKLASLVRSSLTNSEKNFISAGVEIELIKSYLELEKLRFEEDFEYELIEAERLEGIQIPSMIIQPFVENAVKHGLMHKQGEKLIKITFKKKDYLECIIEDNGIGREASKILNEKRGLGHKSFSTHSIEKRFTILKEYYHLDLGFQYEDLEKEKEALGTRVILNIPFIKDRESETINRG